MACFLCAAACPSNCIYIEAAENTEEKRISSAERYAKVYNIDYNRCIFCGYCVEACPTDAITHGHGFELASLNATTWSCARKTCWSRRRPCPTRSIRPTTKPTSWPSQPLRFLSAQAVCEPCSQRPRPSRVRTVRLDEGIG